ncbi:unnamed protein product [Darwinula stevensoni]|uniref:Elongation of very long chain fatty acids protein n=1 Tax=Darwinula stevensoni TaxID=69355 RepID=A0A7R8X7R6_9CRUS|nr:unnamed protein product [Darwinula stevensoni]CAG0887315.1 unnamed protein product [Darwinula stevensoni]
MSAPLLFPFEAGNEPETTLKWIQSYYPFTYPIAIVYLLLIWVLQRWMRSLSPYRLTVALFVWNAGMAAFSAVGAIRINEELIRVASGSGFHATICSNSYLYDPITNYWSYLFVVSKIVELGDTIFLVLRKKPVRFIHWFHHAIVVPFSAYGVGGLMSTGRWFGGLNYFVHTIMYTYFALTTLGFAFARFVPLFITSLQVLQMFLATFATFWTLFALMVGLDCDVTPTNASVSSAVYLFFVILFLKYFLGSLKQRSKRE